MPERQRGRRGQSWMSITIMSSSCYRVNSPTPVWDSKKFSKFERRFTNTTLSRSWWCRTWKRQRIGLNSLFLGQCIRRRHRQYCHPRHRCIILSNDLTQLNRIRKSFINPIFSLSTWTKRNLQSECHLSSNRCNLSNDKINIYLNEVKLLKVSSLQSTN